MGSRTTFSDLIANRGYVQIPIIQRDYAQGRAEQKDVRDAFLRALHNALTWPTNDARLPLDLDFVYGNDASGAFQPLDGQQRLTTLFLLHWYLAWVDGKLEDFRERFLTGGRSRFCYQVRPSSRDFVDEIAGFDPGSFEPEADIAILIGDQQWYVRAWQHDQTVRSSLDMLGAMHLEFRYSSNLYERLVDPECPAVTFQLLDLEDFALTDELYIKMNARGKPLTPFETFKARFEQHLKLNFEELELPQCGGETINKFFANRIDREWSEFFWPYRDKQTSTFDAAIMNLLRVLILVTRDPELGFTTDAEIAALRGEVPNTFMAFHERGWLDRNLVTALVSLLEFWHTLSDGRLNHLANECQFDLGTVFGKIIADPSRLTFQDLILFAGYVQFVTMAAGNIQHAAFAQWMRVVFNLGVNTDYNRNEDLRRSFSGLVSLKSRMNDINIYLAEPNAEIRGFSQPQVLEERVKAKLLGFGDDWIERILSAERHEYLKGQIGFLLNFSGFDLGETTREPMSIDVSEAYYKIKPFDHYFACVAEMLSDLDSGDEHGRAWELALLSVGDVTLDAGRNRALPSFKDGQGSWKRLLLVAALGRAQGCVMKSLWDKLTIPAAYQAELGQIIKTKWDEESWRREFIATPDIFNYCRERLIRFDDAGIYPLKRSQMNGAHVELYTYSAYVNMKNSGNLMALTGEYHETFSAEEPYLTLDCLIDGSQYGFTLTSNRDLENYILKLDRYETISALVETELAREGFTMEGESFSRALKQNELKSAVLALDAALIKITSEELT